MMKTVLVYVKKNKKSIDSIITIMATAFKSGRVVRFHVWDNNSREIMNRSFIELNGKGFSNNFLLIDGNSDITLNYKNNQVSEVTENCSPYITVNLVYGGWIKRLINYIKSRIDFKKETPKPKRNKWKW